jgi:hypothetical protein
MITREDILHYETGYCKEHCTEGKSKQATQYAGVSGVALAVEDCIVLACRG